MQVYPDKFQTTLNKVLSKCYLLFGDEPQQKFEMLTALRDKATQQGFDERTVMVADAEFNWSSLLQATQTLSLFAERQLIELELPTGKPGSEGAKLLVELSNSLSDDVLLVIHGPRIGKDVQRTKWFKALDAHGVFCICYPLEGKQLTNWIAQRLNKKGFNYRPECIKLLADFSEGNLMAASQEIEKLALAFPDMQLDAERLANALVDQSRYNVFQLMDVILQGDGKRCVKMLMRLESEGVEPNIVIWALIKEWQTLWNLLQLQQTNQQIQWIKLGIWQNRQRFYQQAIARFNQQQLSAIGDKLAEADMLFKQTTVMRPFVTLCHLSLLLTGVPLAQLPLADSVTLAQ